MSIPITSIDEHLNANSPTTEINSTTSQKSEFLCHSAKEKAVSESCSTTKIIEKNAAPSNCTIETENQYKLTLKAIRTGLGLSTPKRDVTADCLNTLGSVSKETAWKLSYFCHELLELTNLLDEKRLQSTQEWSELCQVVRQFESLYDSVRIRDSQFAEKVVEQQKKFELRESKYANLIKRALQHIREAQQERDRFFLEAKATVSRAQESEMQLKTLQCCIAEQKETIQILREGSKHMPSEKEITELNLRLRRLQNENSQLMTDCATLRLTYDELMATVQKRLSVHPSLPTRMNVSQIAADVLRTKSIRPFTEGSENSYGQESLHNSKLTELQRLINEICFTIKENKTKFESKLHNLREKKKEYENYKSTMKAMLSNEKPCNP